MRLGGVRIKETEKEKIVSFTSVLFCHSVCGVMQKQIEMKNEVNKLGIRDEMNRNESSVNIINVIVF